MRVRRRHVLIAIIGVAAFVGAVYGFVHLPGVQQRLWDRVAGSIEEETGWRIEAHQIALRVFPAKFEATGLRVSTEDGELLAIDLLQARWRWRALRGLPHRLDHLVVEGVEVDAGAFPRSQEQPDPDQAGLDLFNSFEVGDLTVTGGRIKGSLLEFEGGLEELVLTGSLEEKMASAALTAKRLVLVRDGGLSNSTRFRPVSRPPPKGFAFTSLALREKWSASRPAGRWQ